MMLHTVHFIPSHSAFSNHGAISREFYLFKQRGQFTYLPTNKVSSRHASFSIHLVHLLGEGNAGSNCSNIHALPGNGEPDKGNSEACSDYRVPSADIRISQYSFGTKDLDGEQVQKTDLEHQGHLSSSCREEVGNRVDLQGDLLDRLKAVQLHLLAFEQWNASRLKLCHRAYLSSATNLLHYLALQGLDIQLLKDDLSAVGLLSLETTTSHVFASVTAGIHMLENRISSPAVSEEITDSMSLSCKNQKMLSIMRMKKKLSIHEEKLFGQSPSGRPDFIMVTVGKEAAENETLVDELLKAGADIIRINCAHDNPSVWSEIIRRVKNSSQMLEKSCRILMDLAGPKIRTGPLKPGPNVIKISPKKDSKGDVLFPAKIWLSYIGSGHPPANIYPDASLLLDDYRSLARLEAGDTIRFTDFHGRKRTLKISQKLQVCGGFGFIAECSKTTYVSSGTEFFVKGKKRKLSLGQSVNVPPVEQFVRIKIGDLLVISRDPSLSGSYVSETGVPRITCPSSHLFDSVKSGDPIAFDDGKIWGMVQGVSTSEIIVSVTHANSKGSKLGSEKSINIPKSEVQFEGLTSKDLVDLEFVAENADMVGVSFVRDVKDIVILQHELEKRRIQKLGIVLKIETQSGFENLPLLVLQAMQTPNPLGLMIARGDLAVECGWNKLGSMQEMILSIGNAAHVPVIWATQVLDSLVKSGLPTRAEVTDVTSGMRANCIMLNKGQHIVKAVSTLDSIMRSSFAKNVKAELKPLTLSNNLCQ